MKRFILAGLATIGLSLTSCTSLSPSQQALINQIQQGAVTACGFMPTVESVLALVGGSAGSGASILISAICAAVAPPVTGMKAAPRVAGTPAQAVVNGVKVDGVFVK